MIIFFQISSYLPTVSSTQEEMLSCSYPGRGQSLQRFKIQDGFSGPELRSFGEVREDKVAQRHEQRGREKVGDNRPSPWQRK